MFKVQQHSSQIENYKNKKFDENIINLNTESTEDEEVNGTEVFTFHSWP